LLKLGVLQRFFRLEITLKYPYGLQICARSTTPRVFEKLENPFF
jgi:hypothetical protein